MYKEEYYKTEFTGLEMDSQAHQVRELQRLTK